MSILKRVFSLFFRSQKEYSPLIVRKAMRFKLNRLLRQNDLQSNGWQQGQKATISRQPAYAFLNWVRHILVLCGVLAVFVAVGLAISLHWRAQIALNLMPPREALEAFAEKVGSALPELASLHVAAAPAYEGHTAAFTTPPSIKLISNEPALVQYIAKRYRVANMVTKQLVSTAFDIGNEINVDPLLILAVMAIESSFNPYAESVAGAQGLMQVMTKVHEDKYERFGGRGVALHPPANIRVGAQILRDCINRAGTLEGGLKFYVGATTATDGGYGAKVLAERQRMRLVAGWIGNKHSESFKLAAN